MQFIDLEEVSRIVKLSKATILRHVSGIKFSPGLLGFPPPARRGRGQSVLWIDADVIDWLESQRTYKTIENQDVKRGPGRPRKGAV